MSSWIKYIPIISLHCLLQMSTKLNWFPSICILVILPYIYSMMCRLDEQSYKNGSANKEWSLVCFMFKYKMLICVNFFFNFNSPPP